MESFYNSKDRILQQGVKIEDLKSSIVKTYNKHFMDFIKFDTNLNNIFKLYTKFIITCRLFYYNMK